MSGLVPLYVWVTRVYSSISVQYDLGPKFDQNPRAAGVSRSFRRCVVASINAVCFCSSFALTTSVGQTSGWCCIAQQLAKMSVEPKCIEPTADVLTFVFCFLFWSRGLACIQRTKTSGWCCIAQLAKMSIDL